MPAADRNRGPAAGRFPDWLSRGWGSGPDFAYTKEVLQTLDLHTVCQSARCPNQAECWSRRTATFLILGNVCTRNCRFCSVRTGSPAPLEVSEPARVAEAVARLGIRHAVVTSVTRDDLPDGGAGAFAETVSRIRAANVETTVEVLTPDFGGVKACVETVMASGPDVFGHNIETVRRLYPAIRDVRADYGRSLEVLAMAAALAGPGTLIKSGLMVGHGEAESEVGETLSELYAAGCRAVSIGQYLRPSRESLAVAEYVRPERFREYEERARAMGFAHAVAGPFVRSSYRADAMIGRVPEV